MPERVPKYARSTDGDRLWQGEVLSWLVQVRQRLDTIGKNEAPVLDEMVHPFATLLSQDCDLEADFSRRTGVREAGSLVPSVLFCQVTTVASLRGAVPPGKDVWKRIIQNKDERYHCLEAVPPEQDARNEGIEPLGIDFKLYFTVPTDEVYRRLELKETQRRCRLLSPYLEHLAIRFYYFQARVALPQDHNVVLQTGDTR